MTKRQIRKLALDSIKMGPAVIYDDKQNGYFGFVIFVRDGMRFTVITIDEDIARIDESHIVKHFMGEIEFALNCMKSRPLSAAADTSDTR